ncbi:hypothetical protein EVG20_g833 [Dentipellis fragilis]|uniref:F-box domain-containing protein n=1 Tax=Dentipellis fragilis TaxID=205917 RepID=A0A4Y9ZDC4_9AGAM|nr:hypothetical protein EVG20_g833 [Dentipellis fragilis]
MTKRQAPDKSQGADLGRARHEITGRASKRTKLKDERVKSKRDIRSPFYQQRKDSDFLQLPLDVLYEIFCLLSPGDLLRLARTTKNLRALLMSRKSSFIWKAAFGNTPGPDPIPEPFEGMCEPNWAHLLFGESVCDKCGEENVDVVTFRFKRRLCKACLKKGTCKHEDVLRKFHKYEAEILDIAPWVDAEAAGRVRRGNPDKWYWIEDLPGMNRHIVDFKTKERKSADFRSKFRDWVALESTKLHVFYHRCELFNNWVSELDAWYEAEGQAAEAKRVSEIQRRLLALGHDPKHVRDPTFLALPLIASRKPLTDDLWNKIAPQLIETLREMKHAQISKERTQHIAKLYKDYKKTVLPIQLQYFPTERTMYTFPHIKTLVEGDASIEVTDEEWTEAVAEFSNALMDWMHAKRDKHAAMISKGNYPPSQPMRVVSLEDAASHLNLARRNLMPRFAGPLELAIAVFKEKQYGPIEIGDGNTRTRIGRDFCSFWDEGNVKEYEFFPLGSKTAAALVKLVGKDPAKTTAYEMDNVSGRFCCLDCIRDKAKNWVSGYHWRLAVEHAKKHDHLPQWDTVKAQKLKEKYPSKWIYEGPIAFNAWCCNHCCFPELQKVDVQLHIKYRHGISKPVENRDYFYRTELFRAQPTGQTIDFDRRPQGA